MYVSKLIKEELKRQKKTAKWLYEEFQLLSETTETYQWFTEKLKDDKLSASDLIYIAFVLNMDLRKFTNLIHFNVKNKEIIRLDRRLSSFTEHQQELISQSSYSKYSAERTFYEYEDFIFLLTISLTKDTVVMEKYDLEKETVQTFTRLHDVSLIKDIEFKSIQDLLKMNKDNKFQAIYTQGVDYQSVFPEDYEDENPIRSFKGLFVNKINTKMFL